MKRILHIVGGMNRAGAESMIMNLYRNIDREKYQFDFIYFTSEKCDFDEEIKSLGGRIYRTQFNAAENVSIVKRFIRLGKFLKNDGPFYAVHSHTLFSSCFHLLVANVCGVKKRIAHSHNTNDKNSNNYLGRLYQNLSRWIIKKISTDFIACGIEAGKYLFPSVSLEQINLLPNAIDLGSFANNKDYILQDELGISKDKRIIIQIGRFSKVKNYNFTIDLATYLVNNNITNYKFVFVGDGVEKAKLEEEVKERKLCDYITFLGVRSDIPNLFVNANVMIMPSFHEGFPVVLVEAQASGLPSVISGNISREVDMGLGLISFCELSDPVSIWLAEIERMSRITRPGFDEIKLKLTQGGFSVEESAKNLQKIYG